MNKKTALDDVRVKDSMMMKFINEMASTQILSCFSSVLKPFQIVFVIFLIEIFKDRRK